MTSPTAPTPNELDNRLAELETDPYADRSAADLYLKMLQHHNGAADHPGAAGAFLERVAERERKERRRKRRERRRYGDAAARGGDERG